MREAGAPGAQKRNVEYLRRDAAVDVDALHSLVWERFRDEGAD
jgi:hypothetical protein